MIAACYLLLKLWRKVHHHFRPVCIDPYCQLRGGCDMHPNQALSRPFEGR